MRIWSIHPKQLDRAALIAAWRETLLAQAVLAGNTKGYKNHPQLTRFKATTDPLASIGAYLTHLQIEATHRGYKFNAEKILNKTPVEVMNVNSAQLAFEWEHLGAKLQQRSPRDYERWLVSKPEPHPIFNVVEGEIEPWEKL